MDLKNKEALRASLFLSLTGIAFYKRHPLHVRGGQPHASGVLVS